MAPPPKPTATTASATASCYDFVSSFSKSAQNVHAEQQQNEALNAVSNNTPIPENYNENAVNDAVINFSKSAADTVVKGAQLPGTIGGGMVTTPSVKNNE